MTPTQQEFHGFYADEDGMGFFIARCSCGWTVGAFPDVTDAADAYGDHRATTTITDTKPAIIGREQFIIEELAKRLQGQAKRHHDYTLLRDTENRRGFWFEVQIRVSGEQSGHVARVTVELDRYEP